MSDATIATIDQYIAAFPPQTQDILQKIRQIARAVATNSTEAISYAIPVIKINGKNTVFFAGWKTHVSLYPVPGNPDLQHDLKPYLAGRGTLKFPLNKPVPYELIERIIAALVKAEQKRQSTT